MGNVASSNKKKSQRWNWDIKNGRAQVKPRAKPPPARPLFVQQTPSQRNRDSKYSLWYDSNSDEVIPPRTFRKATRKTGSRRAARA